MSVDVSKSRDFQRRFNGFYRIRRNSEWQKHFYTILQKYKHTGISFVDTLNKLYILTGKVEASFSSKLVATIQPNKPVIDKFVLSNLNLKLPYSYKEDRIEKVIAIYHIIENSYVDFLKTENGRYLVEKFNSNFSNTNITEIKMLDLVLWQTR